MKRFVSLCSAVSLGAMHPDGLATSVPLERAVVSQHGRWLESGRVEFGPHLAHDGRPAELRSAGRARFHRASGRTIGARAWALRTPAHYVASAVSDRRPVRTVARPCILVRFVATGLLLAPVRIGAERVVRHVAEIVEASE